jgi:hypothetical protein
MMILAKYPSPIPLALRENSNVEYKLSMFSKNVQK